MPRRSVVSRITHHSVDEPPYLDGSAAWWEALPEDFHQREERFALHPADVRPIRYTAGFDTLLRAYSGLLLGATAFPRGYRNKRMDALEKERHLYEAVADRADPKAFFRDPTPGQQVTSAVAARTTLFLPRDGAVEDLRFDSAYEPFAPSLRESYRRNERNQVAHARYWRHHGPPRPTIIAIHGFTADLYFVNEWFFALPWLYRMGADLVLFTLPFHGPRQARSSPFSGHGFFAGGPQRLNEAFGQAVHDLRVFIDYLIQVRGVPQVGVTGVSLGGYTSALLASVDDRLAFALPNVPVASLPDLGLEWNPLGHLIRWGLQRRGLSLQDARKLVAPTSPLTYQPAIPMERLMVIGGVGDRLAPPKHTRLLWDHWKRCRIHWFPGSHLIHLDRDSYLHQVARFLRGVSFLDADHPGPG